MFQTIFWREKNRFEKCFSFRVNIFLNKPVESLYLNSLAKFVLVFLDLMQLCSFWSELHPFELLNRMAKAVLEKTKSDLSALYPMGDFERFSPNNSSTGLMREECQMRHSSTELKWHFHKWFQFFPLCIFPRRTGILKCERKTSLPGVIWWKIWMFSLSTRITFSVNYLPPAFVISEGSLII